jgi:hypothetical protein
MTRDTRARAHSSDSRTVVVGVRFSERDVARLQEALDRENRERRSWERRTISGLVHDVVRARLDAIDAAAAALRQKGKKR